MSPVEILDRLIEICVDSEKRYQHAANDVGRDDLESFFNQRPQIARRLPTNFRPNAAGWEW